MNKQHFTNNKHIWLEILRLCKYSWEGWWFVCLFVLKQIYFTQKKLQENATITKTTLTHARADSYSTQL